MFDTHNIAFSRRRSKKKYNEHGIFGVPLQLLLEHDQKISPNTAHIPIVFQETLRQEIEERFYQGAFVWGQDLTTNDVAALMKQFLRDLPALLDLLIKIVENSAKNKMSLNKKMKFLQKKDKTDFYKKPAVKHEEGVIRVQAPKLSLASTKVQLDLGTTAGDIVSRFCFQNDHTSRVFHAADKNTFLFEVGGNIGERCLPDSTNMLALYKVNPNAEWIIKHKDRVKVTLDHFGD
ncbi:RHG18-like protein, partial [Mya arenaria]